MSDVGVVSDTVHVAEVRYAGFWIRFFAYLGDSIFIIIITTIITLPIPLLFHISSETVYSDFILNAISDIVIFILSWLYLSLFESSKFMATPGKMLVGIKVTDLSKNDGILHRPES